jgi:hypothetical protein
MDASSQFAFTHERENAMTTFISPNFPKTHAGAERIEAVIATLQGLVRQMAGAKGIATLLLAGAVSTLVLVADQVAGAWTDDHLLLAWAATWAMVFAALAMLGGSARNWAVRALAAYEANAVRRARHAADARTWSVALTDPRLMSELQSAFLRAENRAEELGEVRPHWPFSGSWPHGLAARQLFRGAAPSWRDVNHII